MRKFFGLALLAALVSGCGRKPSGEEAFNKGLAYYKDEKFDKAATSFEDALATMQTNALALNFLGVSQLKNGETAAGTSNLQEAVTLDPNYLPARYDLALAELEAGQGDEAVRNLRQVALNSSAPADVYYQLGLAYMRVSAWGQAEEAFKRHSHANPTSADTFNCLGIVAARKSEFAQSKQYFEQAIAADKNFATAYLNLASLEHHQLSREEGSAHALRSVSRFASEVAAARRCSPGYGATGPGARCRSQAGATSRRSAGETRQTRGGGGASNAFPG